MTKQHDNNNTGILTHIQFGCYFEYVNNYNSIKTVYLCKVVQRIVYCAYRQYYISVTENLATLDKK